MYYQLLMPKATRSPYPELGIQNPLVLYGLGEKPAAYEYERVWAGEIREWGRVLFTLEDIWWRHNGHHRPLAKQRRSMTLGDIVLIGGQVWVASLEGFTQLTGHDIPQSVQQLLTP